MHFWLSDELDKLDHFNQAGDIVNLSKAAFDLEKRVSVAIEVDELASNHYEVTFEVESVVGDCCD